MTTELTSISDTVKRIKIEIEPDAIKRVYDKVSRSFANRAQLPGFRKGMAPVDVIKTRYAEEIKGEVIQELVPPLVTEAILEHQLSPLAEPQLHLENAEDVKVNGSQPIVVSVSVEVMPEIPTPNYDGLEATRRERPVTDEDINGIIDEQREREATFVPEEGRESKIGDTIVVDLKGTFEGEPNRDPIEVNDLDIKLGDEVIEKSFSDNLCGMKADDEKDFTVTYPEDFSSAALAGKTVNYHAKAKAVGQVELPAIDDEWVESLGEDVKTVNDLREKLRADMQVSAQADADARVKNDLIAKLIEANEFEVPMVLQTNQARNLLNSFAQDLSQRGVDINQVDNEFLESTYAQMFKQAESDVRGAVLLGKIAEAENLEVTDDMLADEFQEIANQYGMSLDDVKKTLDRDGNIDSFRENLRTRMAVDAIYKKAKISNGDWVNPNVENSSEETGARKKESKQAKEKAEKPKEAKASGKSKKAAKKDVD